MAEESDQATAGELAAIRRADAAEARVAELEAENAALRASLTATRGHVTRAKAEAAVLREEKSPTPRKFGRPPGRFGKPGAPYDPALAALAIYEEEALEIVASDGKAEIVDLHPFTVTGDAWRRMAGGWLLDKPIDLEPGDCDAPFVEVAGFALVTRGDKPAQVGWRELPDPVRVPKNGRVRIERSIIF